MNTIFVAIASYLDYEIKHTILSCIDKAKHPENLRFGICLQYDENPGTDIHCLDFLENKFPIKILKYHYTESNGGCWARNLAQSLYDGEEYSLQVDSHTRFIQNWDEIVINDYKELKKTVNKPLISFLPPSYSRMDDKGIDFDFKNINDLDKINHPKFEFITEEYWPSYGGYSNEQHTGFKPSSVIILYGGFVFTEGNWVVEVTQDPDHYYTGEEFALTIRSYTKGYDLFTPSQIVAWHRAHPKAPKKHLNNNPEEVVLTKHRHAINRLKMLIEGTEDLGQYGVGNIRTIDQYAEFAKIDFKNKKVIQTKKIAFFTKSFNERGTSTVLYDYAYYNQKILKNESIIICYENNIKLYPDVYEKFKKEFKIFLISSKFSEIDEILLQQKCDMLYIIKAGEPDEEVTTACKCAIHCVYGAYTPHGDIYLPVGPANVKLNERYCVPHMINLPDVEGDMREELGINKEALVFGGYGGVDSFNIEFVHECVYKIAKNNPNIYFIFANFLTFCPELPNIIHLPRIIDLEKKVQFINTCDAMLHAQGLGETFGLAIGEFSSKNKPIICSTQAKDSGSKIHVYLLGDKAFYYESKEELKNIILSFNKEINSHKDWNAFKEYNPENVMKIFNELFIEG